ncbi:MFS transporter [Halopiger djelfimassiliensis]|uniref:MFS transporter n=1 Tax=Halopiger djelfimassiliensis TaxID=1293047 RepID=UPI0006782E9F|nr:MFS transporter [Halopiger djelfimassiliensis]
MREGIAEGTDASDEADVTVRGSPRQGLVSATLGFFVGFAGVVLYGPVASAFEGAMDLSGLLLGLLVAAPQLTGSLLRIPFGAWVEDVGAKKPFLVLLGLSIVGMGGLSVLLLLGSPNGLTTVHYPIVFGFGALSGCGIATFAVGTTQTSYWYPAEKQGTMLAVFGGLGNASPGLFTLVLPVALAALGLTGAYLAWFAFLVVGTLAYARYAVDAPSFQFREHGIAEREARRRAEACGQELFPGGDAMDSVRNAATILRTWVLVALFFTSFGGFLALTTWLPSYWRAVHGVDVRTAGALTAVAFTLLAAVIRVPGGIVGDRIGGERTAIVGFGAIASATAVLVVTREFVPAVAATVLLAAGMGVASAAVFGLVPAYVPDAVGGASGLVGGIGAFGGFVIPPILGLFVDRRGTAGYATGLVVVLVLGIISFGLSIGLYRTRSTLLPDGEGSSVPRADGEADSPVDG